MAGFISPFRIVNGPECGPWAPTIDDVNKRRWDYAELRIRPKAPPEAVKRCVSSPPGIGTIEFKGQPIGSLVSVLPQFVQRQVIDRTR